MTHLQLERNNKSPNYQHKEGQNQATTSKLPDDLFLAARLLAVAQGREFTPGDAATMVLIEIFVKNC